MIRMADEIVQNLIEKITQNFNEKCRNHYLIQKFEKKVLSGKADLTDVERYAGSIGSQLSKSLLESIDFTEFENGRMYLELSEEILTQTLKNNYNLINQAAEKVQKDLDSRLGFMIKSQKADFPIDRIKAIASSLCDKTVSDDTIRRRMSSPVENVTHSFYTDSVKKNAQFRNDAGLKCYLVRKTNGKCCDWCSSIAGRYVYGDHPDDIFRRHDNCGCTVTFENGRVRQNVWTKRTWEVPDIDIEPYEPAVISPEKSKMLQEKNLPKTLTGKGNGGIIKNKGSGGLNIDMQFFAEKDIEKQESSSLLRAMRKYNQRIEEHKLYIHDPKSHCPDWDSYSEQKKAGLIRHWSKEINNFEESIQNRIDELKKRGEYDE